MSVFAIGDAVPVRHAQVALEHLREPGHVALGEGLVEAERLAQLLEVLRASRRCRA